MTSNGTERVFEAYKKLDENLFYCKYTGDEPFIKRTIIRYISIVKTK